MVIINTIKEMNESIQLFNDKKVSRTDKAAKFYYCDEEFQKYSIGTFRGYFKKQNLFRVELFN